MWNLSQEPVVFSESLHRSGICSHRQNLLRFSDDGEADAADPALAATIFMSFGHVCGVILMQLILFVRGHDVKDVQ